MALPPPVRSPPPAANRRGGHPAEKEPVAVVSEQAARPRFLRREDEGKIRATNGGLRPTAAGRETAEERAARDEAVATARERNLRAARRRTLLAFVFFGGTAYLIGWHARHHGWWPGVFLASDVGLPVLLVLTLQGVARIMRRGIRDGEHGRAAASLARGGGWALGSFWALWSITTVPQLAIGIGVAVLAFALYWTRDRLARLGFEGYGPSFRATLLILAAYPLWIGVQAVAGPAPFFDLLSLFAVVGFAFVMLRRSLVAARAADLMRGDPAVAARARADAAGATRSSRLIVVLIGSYLVFTLIISPAIPYGPVVEWFVVALAPLLFALVVASRIGTVPTRRALPPPEMRSHEQRVYSLPDHHLADVESHLSAYVHHNRNRDWIAGYAQRLFAESRLEPAEYAPLLGRLEARRSSEATRRALLHELAVLLERAIPERGNGITGTLKTKPAVRSIGTESTAATV